MGAAVHRRCRQDGPAPKRAGGQSGRPDRSGFRTAAGWVHATRVLSESPRRTARRRGRRDRRRARAAASPCASRRDADGRHRAAARVDGGALADVEALGIGFEADADERFLGFGERANARRAARRSASRTTSPTGPYQPDEPRSHRRSSCRRRASAPATTRPTSRCRGCSRAAATACSSTTTRPAYFRLGTERRRWSVEVRRARGLAARPPPDARLRVFAGPRARRRRCARFTAPHRAPAARRRRRGSSARGSSRPATTPSSSELRDAARGRRAGRRSSQTYLHYLPCGDQRGHARPSARARPRSTHARRRGHDLLQPDDLHDATRRVYDRGRGGRRAHAGRDRRRRTSTATPAPTHRSTSGSSTSRAPAGRRLLRRPARRGGRRRLRRLDGGLRRVHAARRALRRRR